MRILVVATNVKIRPHGGSTHVGSSSESEQSWADPSASRRWITRRNITSIAKILHPPSPFKHLVSLGYFPKPSPLRAFNQMLFMSGALPTVWCHAHHGSQYRALHGLG